MPNEKKLICIAVITAAHGIKGEVKIKSFTQPPEEFANYTHLTNSDGSKKFNINISSDIGGDSFIASVEGVKTRTEAEYLKATELYVNRDEFPETDEDEFYYEDLIGLEVRSINGKKMAIVTAIYNHGAGDVLEIKMNNSGKTELIAFTFDNVPEIDVKAGYVVVHMPEIQYVGDNDN